MPNFAIPPMEPLQPLKHPMTKHVEQLKLNRQGGGSGSDMIVPQYLNASETTNNTTAELVSYLVDSNVAAKGDTPTSDRVISGGGRKMRKRRKMSKRRKMMSKRSKRGKMSRRAKRTNYV